MKRRGPFTALIMAMVFFWGTTSGPGMDDSVLRAGPCQVEVIVNHGRVCLDGEWILSQGILGKNAVYRFVQERGYLLLVPHLDAAQRADLITRIGGRDLEAESLEEALSIQGMVLEGGLVFDQRNALVTWPETTRIRLFWTGKFFSGQAVTIRKDAGSIKPVHVRLVRRGDAAQLSHPDESSEDTELP